MAKLVNVILEKIEVHDIEDMLGVGELYFHGAADGEPIGNSKQIFSVSSASTIWLAGQEWQQVVDVDKKASITLKLEGHDRNASPDNRLGVAKVAVQGPWNRTPPPVKSDKGGFTLHYRVAPCGPQLKAPASVPASREHTASTFKTTVSSPPKVEIRRDNKPITAANRTVIVGQKVKLQTHITGVKSAPTGYRWAMSGVVVKNYKGTKTKGEKTELQPADLSKKDAEFYWADAGDKREVRCTVTVGGREVVGTATLDVKRPNCTYTTETSNVKVTKKYVNPGTWLAFGGRKNGATKPGIVYKAKVEMPAGFANGKWHYVQIVKTVRRATDNANAKKKLVSNDWVLDTTYPYEPAPYDPDAGSPGGYAADKTEHKDSDSPGSKLTGTLKKCSADDKFKMFVMFKPDGADSIFVPLKVVKWFWKGAATRAGANWTLDAGSASSGADAAVDTTGFPVWTKNVTSLAWAPG